MATSNSYSFTVNTYSIIYDAAYYTGKLGLGDTLEPLEYNLALRVLNSMDKNFMAAKTGGIPMYLREQGYLFLSANTGTYFLSANSTVATNNSGYFTNQFSQSASGGNNPAGNTVINVANVTVAVFAANNQFGIELDSGQLFWSTIVSSNAAANTVTIASPLPTGANGLTDVVFTFANFAQPPQNIEDQVLRDVNGNDTDLRSLSLEEWMSLPSKQSPGFFGDPVGFYYEPHMVGNQGQGYGSLQTDVNQAQDVSKYIVLHYIREIQDFVNPQDEPDYPKEFFEVLYMNLSKRMCGFWRSVWTKEQEEMRITAMAIASKANPRRSVMRFNPNYRGQVSSDSRYR